VADDFCSLEDLDRLPEDDRTVLIGLAGLGLPTSNSHLARVLAETLALPRTQAWAANPRLMQERLLRLKSLGLAETTRQGYWTCAEKGLESAARMAHAQGLLRRLHQGAVAGTGFGSVQADARGRCRAELRLAFLEGDHQRWLPLRERFAQQFGATIRCRDPLGLICGGPFEPSWFETLGPAAQAYGCQALLLDQVLLGLRSPAFLAWMETEAKTPRPTPSALTIMLFLVLQDRSLELGAWMARQPAGTRNGYAWPALEGLAALAAGEPARSAAGFAQSLARLRQATGRRDPLLPGLYEPFHILALLGTREAPAARRAQERIDLLGRRDREDPLHPIASNLQRLALALAGGCPAPRKAAIMAQLTPRSTAFSLCLETLGAYLAGETVAPELPDRLLRASAPLPLAWLSAALGELRNRLQDQPPQPNPLLDLVPQQAAWERALESLRRLRAPDPGLPS
jgi:hypothetical protein